METDAFASVEGARVAGRGGGLRWALPVLASALLAVLALWSPGFREGPLIAALAER